MRSTEAGFSPAFDEEEVTSFEIGIKSTWLDNRLRFNGAAFRTEYDDMQIQQITDVATIFLTDVFNAGEAEIDGFEFDLTAMLTEGLLVTVNYGYTDAQFKSVVTPSGDITDFFVMPYAPRHSYNVTIDYEFAPLSFATLRASANYSWRDEQVGTADIRNDIDGFFLDDYGLFNARLTMDDIKLGGPGTFKISAWGKNLDNKDYLVHSISQGSSHNAYFGERRSYGVDVTYQF